MDKSIGEVLNRLDQKGLTENTIVIFFSDNGGSGSADNRPLRGRKGDMWEGGIRVPCLVRWPGVVRAGTVSDEFLTSLEILPTLAAACGFTVPNGREIDGYDMLPVLQGAAKSPRTQMFWKRKDELAARVGSWKYVKMAGEEQLYDLASDKSERHNLADSQPRQLAAMKAAFARWQEEMQAADPRGPFRDY
jgi:arylsulfatase A-like enzyme